MIKGDRKPRPRELTPEEKTQQLQARLWIIKGAGRSRPPYRYGQLEFSGQDMRKAIIGLCRLGAGWR